MVRPQREDESRGCEVLIRGGAAKVEGAGANGVGPGRTCRGQPAAAFCGVVACGDDDSESSDQYDRRGADKNARTVRGTFGIGWLRVEIDEIEVGDAMIGCCERRSVGDGVVKCRPIADETVIKGGRDAAHGAVPFEREVLRWRSLRRRCERTVTAGVPVIRPTSMGVQP